MEYLRSSTPRTDQVQRVLEQVYAEILVGGIKPSVADFVRLIQLSGDLTPADFDQVTVEWVETIELEPAGV